MVQSPQSSGPVLPIHHCQCLTFIKKCAFSVKKSSALNGRRRTEMDDTYHCRRKFLYHSRREFSMPELTRSVWEIRVFARHGWHLVLKFVPNPRMETEARKQMGIQIEAMVQAWQDSELNSCRRANSTPTSIYHPRTISEAQLCLNLPMLLQTKRFKGTRIC